nr:OFA family MFS transporter [Candidatus Njordarchaeum guaymaensis]
MNRWTVVMGAIMVQLALGAIYAWSAFTTPLQGTATNSSQYNFSKTETQAIFSAGLATFAVVMILAGRLQQKIAPRTVAILGGVLLGAGYVSAGFVGASFIGKLLTIGIVGGAGIGFTYVVPIAVGVRWFPDRKGLLSGLAVAGFGFGAFIWIMVASPPAILGTRGLINVENGVYTIANVDRVFVIYGIVFLVLIVVGSLVMVNPPEGFKPSGYASAGSEDRKSRPSEGRDYSSGDMLKTWQFYAIWSMFMFGTLTGLMVIGNVQNFAKDLNYGFQSHGFTVTQASDFAVIGAAICLPILNGIGRIVWGTSSDKIGTKRALLFMFLLQGMMTLTFFFTTVNEYLFYIVGALIGFNFGGNLALFPAATADFFGNKNLGANYGLVFTAYGVGGIIGPILAGMVQDYNLSFLYAFVPASLLCFVAAIMAFIIRTAGRRED